MAHPSNRCHVITNIQPRKIFLRNKSKYFNCLRVGHISKNCLQNSSCYSCGLKYHISMCDKKANSLRNWNNLIEQWKKSYECLCNCSAVKVNNENNSSNDCAAGQTSGGNSSANISAAMVNNSEISNSTNIVILQRRQAVKLFCKKCVYCNRYECKPFPKQLSNDLSNSRV